MANIKDIVAKVLNLADSVNEYLPGAPLTQGAIDLARKVGDLVDTIDDEIPLDQQAQAKAARAQLAEAVKAKAASTSNRLRGGH